MQDGIVLGRTRQLDQHLERFQPPSRRLEVCRRFVEVPHDLGLHLGACQLGLSVWPAR